MLELELAELATSTIDFQNEALESALEQTLTAFGKLAKTAVELDGLTDESVLPVSKSVLELAKQFGIAFKDLEAEQAQKVKDAMKGVVTGENELLVERFFDEALDFILSGQNLNAVADSEEIPGEPDAE